MTIRHRTREDLTLLKKPAVTSGSADSAAPPTGSRDKPAE